MTRSWESLPFTFRVALAFLCVYVIWGSTYLAIRFAIETLPPFLMAGARYLLAGALMYVFLRGRGEASPTRGDWRVAAVIGGFLLLGGNGGVVWAEQTVPSGIAALIVSTVPLWMAALDWLGGGMRPRFGVLLGLVVGFIGVAILIGPDALSLNSAHVDPFGALVLVGASLSWSIGSLYARGGHLSTSALMGTAIEMIAGGILLALVGFLAGESARLNLNNVSSNSAFAFIYLILFGSIVGFSAYTWLLRVVSPARVSTYAYVNPVIAVSLGWAMAGEALTLRTLISAAIIIASVALITIMRGQPRKEGIKSEESAVVSAGE